MCITKEDLKGWCNCFNFPFEKCDECIEIFKTKVMSKWFYPAQKQINKETVNGRLVEQIISNNDVFEKYIIQYDKEMYCVLYQIKKDEYNKEGFKILKYKSI